MELKVGPMSTKSVSLESKDKIRVCKLLLKGEKIQLLFTLKFLNRISNSVFN